MRKIVFEERPVDTREGNRVEIFTLKEIESHFTETLRQIMSQIKLADTVSVQGHAEDAEEILRSQIVLAEAAYDYFLHELLRLGIMKLYKGYWEDKGEKYMELQLSMKVLERALEAENEDWLKEWVAEKYSYITLMDYEIFRKEVCGVLGISVKDVADLAFYSLGSNEKTVKKLENELKEIYKRRNQIAHQSDRHIGTAKRAGISKEYVLDKINIIKKIVMALCEIAREKGNKKSSHKDIGEFMEELYTDIVNVLTRRTVILSTQKKPAAAEAAAVKVND